MEITESAAATDPERAQRVLRELHDHGFVLAIDDFGTGYSSFARLKDLPIDILKIDRGFIESIPGDPATTSMVRGIVQLARSLSLVPLAEGIEREEQARCLQADGCAIGQGFLFSRPLPGQEILARYGQHAIASNGLPRIGLAG